MDRTTPQASHFDDLPWAGINLQDPDSAIRLFERAAAANIASSSRQGSCIHLGGKGRLLMTGDLHDHTNNLLKILKLSGIHRDPSSHVVLHEMIHGPHRINGCDLSVRTLGRVAAIKCQFPGQVHLLQSNHELAQLMGQSISKDGVSVIGAFDDGIDFIYGDRSEDVRRAVKAFIRSYPLAIQCENRLFCSHSLPAPRRLAGFDPDVIHREMTDADLSSGGSAHMMVWGRNHDDDLAVHLGQAWDTDLFVTGHQPAEMGYATEGTRILILASDHEHGVALPIDLSRRYTLGDLKQQLVPLASITA